MPSRPPSSKGKARKYSAKLAEILGDEKRGIFRGMSGEAISKRLAAHGFRLSDTAAIYLRRGLWGRLENVRNVGRVWAGELLRDWSEEIAEATGAPAGPERAVAWLAWIAETDGKVSSPAETVQTPGTADFTPEQWREFLSDTLERSISEQQRVAAAMASWFWRISQLAERAVVEGRTPPPLPCPPSGWQRLTLAEADKLLDEYREACGISADAPTKKAWSDEGGAE